MFEFSIKAEGKINLGLDVTGRREDGYHLVRMVMQTVKLYDRLTFSKLSGPDIRIRSNVHFLPVNENNLVYKAIRLVKDEYGIEDGVKVFLEKRIPVAAGMAGGSADAAATLIAMNHMFDLGMTSGRMAELGLRLGADVPYCLMGGTALAEGIGEILSPLPAAPAAHVLLVKPNISISTKTVYEKIDSVGNLCHPDIDGIISAISDKDLHGLCARMGNVLETVSCGDYPIIEQIKSRMRELGAVGAMMSGSGPTVFGLFDDKKAAQQAYYEFKGGQLGRGTFLSEFTNA